MPSWNESLRAVVDGERLPGGMEDLRAPLSDAIASLTREVSEAHQQRASSLEEQLLADGSQALAIMGERGSGKTTLLTAVCADLLRGKQHLVLPIIRPEFFASNDSVIATFLAELWDAIPRDAGSEDVGSSIRLLADAARGFAIAQTPWEMLESASDGPSDFANDLLLVSRSRVRLAKQLRAVARAVCTPADTELPRLIVVPVDDPDLSHESIAEILGDLQVLGSIPGVVPIACFSPVDLREAWMDRRRTSRVEVSEDQLQFLLARQLEKVFPYRYRFEIEPVAAALRPGFTPVGETRTLADALHHFQSQVRKISGSLWRIDEHLLVGYPEFGLPNPMPSNARTLVQLWESLAVMDNATYIDDMRVEGQMDHETMHLTLRRALDILTERLASRSSPTLERIVAIGPSKTGAADRRTASIGRHNLDLFLTASRDWTGKPRTLATVELRPVATVMARQTDGGEQQGVAAGTRARAAATGVPADIVSQLLAMQELVLGSGVYEVDDNPGASWIGMDNWRFLQQVNFAGNATDNCFILLPDASTFSEVATSCRLWNELVELTADAPIQSVLATAIDAACATVDGRELTRVDDYEAAFGAAGDIVNACYQTQGSTARSFVRWFARDLPFQWHAGLLSPRLIRDLSARHGEAVRTIDSTIDTTGAHGRSMFDHRLALILDARDPQDDQQIHGWIGGYFEAAAGLRSIHLHELSQIHRRWHRDVAAFRAGGPAAEFVTTRGRSGGMAAMAPYVTPEGTALLGAALKALERAASDKPTHK